MMFLHAIQKVECAGDIVVIISEWLLDGFADGFETSKMNDGVERIGREYFV